MKPDHTPLHDPLRTETPGLGPAPLRHDIGQNISPDIGAMRTQTWESRPRRRVQWPFWVAGLAVLGVVAAMMFDVKPDQWVSAHLDRPAPASESVPLPLPSQPAPQAQTDVPPLPSVAQAPETGTPAASPGTADAARSRPESSRSTTVAQAALQPRADRTAPNPADNSTSSSTTSEPPTIPAVPADPKPVPVDPAAPATGP
jgi:hypothetical protein